jgi:hypothetical protein
MDARQISGRNFLNNFTLNPKMGHCCDEIREGEMRITGLKLSAKSENIAGLQLADLVLTPIGRYILGKAIKEDFRIIESKFRRSKSGQWKGYGLVVLPK